MEQKHTILIIEDEYNIRHLLELLLTENGFIATGFESAESALKKILSLKPALILLDIQLPGMNGFECCKSIRSDLQTKDIPIIFLSAHSSDAYKIAGLESGADDFIMKPFSNGELLARIKAVLRRVQKTRPSTNHIVQDGPIALNLETHTATINKKKVKLAPKEFSMLTLFIQSKGEVLSRDALSTQAWECISLATSRTIDVHIARLRKKLGKFSKAIQTVGKVGYRYTSL